MASNEPTATDGYTWVTAQVTHADKAMLLRLTELDTYENGTMGSNMSATLRRLIRQEAQRRLAQPEAVPA